ncbi:HNH endonuclease [Streptomyces sp. NBC_01725]
MAGGAVELAEEPGEIDNGLCLCAPHHKLFDQDTP